MSPRRGPRRSLLGAPPEPFWRPLGPTRGLPKPAKTTKTIEKPSFLSLSGGSEMTPLGVSWGAPGGLLGMLLGGLLAGLELSCGPSWGPPWALLGALLGPPWGAPGDPKRSHF